MHEVHIDIVQLQLCKAHLECAQWVPVVFAPAGLGFQFLFIRYAKLMQVLS